jgi:SPP1 gp7 family putative phage head morphogenesis protein
MADPLIIGVMTAQKAAILQGEAQQMRAFAQRWIQVERALVERMETLATQLAADKAAGKPITTARLLQLERYQSLVSQARRELREFTNFAADRIADGQLAYAQMATQHALAATQAVNVGIRFDLLPTDAIQNLIASTSAGSPLAELLERTWPDAVAGMTKALVEGIALGRSPRQTAVLMQKGLGVGLNKALLITRTEQLRAYREAARQQYRASGVVDGYRRLATKDSRVCPACLMSDGQRYDLDETLDEHPQGRCTMVPLVTGAPDLDWLRGPDWFRAQGIDDQRAILGPGRFDAWQDGRFDLDELTVVKQNNTWGGSLQTKPLKELV